MAIPENLTWALIGAAIGAVLGLALTLVADTLLTMRRHRNAVRRWAKLGLDFLKDDEKVVAALRNMLRAEGLPSIQGALHDRRWQLLQTLLADAGKGPEKLPELHQYADLLGRFEEAQFKVPAAAHASEEYLQRHARLAQVSARDKFESIVSQQPRLRVELEAMEQQSNRHPLFFSHAWQRRHRAKRWSRRERNERP